MDFLSFRGGFDQNRDAHFWKVSVRHEETVCLRVQLKIVCEYNTRRNVAMYNMHRTDSHFEFSIGDLTIYIFSTGFKRNSKKLYYDHTCINGWNIAWSVSGSFKTIQN